MKKLMYKIANVFLIVFDLIATALVLPWEYSDSHKRKMKEAINGKK